MVVNNEIRAIIILLLPVEKAKAMLCAPSNENKNGLLVGARENNSNPILKSSKIITESLRRWGGDEREREAKGLR